LGSARKRQPVAPGRVREPAVIPAVIAVVTFLAFLPALQNGFVNWDDQKNLTNNPMYRGLGWTQLTWMFGGNSADFYMPLTWFTFAVDYTVWGMNPSGYHLTSLILHAVNAGLFYFVALRLLNLPRGAGASRDVGSRAGAAFAALLFSLHPLRVESVAWATERRDVLSGLFYLLAVLAYLRACEPRPPGERRAGAWYWVAVAAAACALLSKPMAVSLPVVLVLLDVYPLRRLGAGPSSWFAPAARRVWLEKLPFVLLSAAASVLTLLAYPNLNDPTLLPQVGGWRGRLAVPLYGLAFYLWKTAWPSGLSPVYETPVPFDPTAWPFLLSATVVAGVTVAAIALRRRPAPVTVWLSYVAILLPVLGIFQFHGLIAADRYTYLASLGWALLAGAGLAAWWRAGAGHEHGHSSRFLIVGLALSLLTSLGFLTWRQTQVWHDSEALWTYALSINASAIGHTGLGDALVQQRQVAEGIEHYRQALRLNPRYAAAHNNLGLALAQRGEIGEAIRHFRQVLLIVPKYAESHYSLGLALALQGETVEAVDQYRQALRIRPDYAEAHNNLGNALVRQGQVAEGIEHYRRALRLDPRSAAAHNNLGLALAQQGDLPEAVEHFREALRIEPNSANALRNLEMVLSGGGQDGRR
jgi:tetratricopeptide (TPR) repeat protein